jgi:hypothetical protein
VDRFEGSAVQQNEGKRGSFMRGPGVQA